MLALGALLCAPAVAEAGHTITPGYFPNHLNPHFDLDWGIPGPDPLRRTGFTECTGKVYRGTKGVARYVRHWWGKRLTQFYNCRPPSLHGEGRAFDYFLDKNRPRQLRKGNEIFRFFRKRDEAGARAVAMRRFGVQTVIWNCRVYTSTNLHVRLYDACDPNDDSYTTDPSARHENHVHIDLNWKGAWRKRTAWTGYKPCDEGHGGCPLMR